MLKESIKVLSNATIVVCLFFAPIFSYSQHYQDCDQSFPVCNKQTYFFEEMKGEGLRNDNFGKLSCSPQLHETNSKWMRFTIEQAGIITFFINPNGSDDDIDFILFKKKSKDCSDLQEVRCMAAGVNLHDEAIKSAVCKGATGLSYQSIDDFEQSGCKYESDNFLKFLAAKENEEYFLLINNFNSSEGFSITFDGDAEFAKIENCKEYSKDVPLEITSLRPNPAHSYIDVSFRSENEIPILIEVFTIEGKRVKEKTISVTKGDHKYPIDIQNMSHATYLLRFTQGKYATIRQFVKI